MSAIDDAGASLFEQVGGERLRAVIEDFYQRVFTDPMIGFLFAGKDRARLVDKEWELAARMLGGPVTYTGRTMPAAHARVPITGGHFDRRTRLLEQAMDAHAVPPAARAAWLAHTAAMRAQITADRGSDCDHDAAAARTTVDASPSAPLRLGRR